jgi:hypothetical protein
MRGMNLSAVFRQGTGKRYEQRPPANCVAARRAWDHFSTLGEIEWLQLLDGYWGAQLRGERDVTEIEAIEFRRY